MNKHDQSRHGYNDDIYEPAYLIKPLSLLLKIHLKTTRPIMLIFPEDN